jgi:hypothetical protein
MFSRFCAHCGKSHTNRKSPFCSPGCRRADKNSARGETAKHVCRLCGRRFRKRHGLAPPNDAGTEFGPVRPAHKAIEGTEQTRNTKKPLREGMCKLN